MRVLDILWMRGSYVQIAATFPSQTHPVEGTRLFEPGWAFCDEMYAKWRLYFRHASLLDVAQAYWERITSHFPLVELDEWVVIPNHVHGIILIPDSTRRDVQLNAPTIG